jgi:RND superfamily putative drug exporter
MATLLYRIGRFAARRGILVVVGWIVLLVLIVGGGQLLKGTFASAFEIPGTESQQAIDMLDQRFPAASGGSARVIFVAPEGRQISEFESEIAAADTALRGVDQVSSVAGPFDEKVTGQISTTGADAGTMAFSAVQLSVASSAFTNGEELMAAGDSVKGSGLTVAYSGLTDVSTEAADTELIGLAVAFVVLLITFGSLLAAGMPLVTAIIGVAIAYSLIVLSTGFADVSSTAPLLATMLGLAVGIDYALFIVSRHRMQLIRGMDPKESAAVATSTAGSAVVFAGLTVVIALLGLAVVQIPFLTVMGLGAAVAVVVAVLVALTLLPAVLGLLGRTLVPKPTSRSARRELAAEGTHRTFGARWVALVTAKPVITVAVVVIGLVVVALPVGSMRLTLPDAGYNPEGSVSRTGYDLLDQGFGPGFNGPLLVTADISGVEFQKLPDAAKALQDQFGGLADVEAVSQALPNPAFDMLIVSITPDSAPDSEATQNLVQSIRSAAPAFEEANGFGYRVTGQTALGIDVSDRLQSALVPYGIVVVGLCLILLTIVFRSLAVPISATIGYLLSVFASFGIVTAVFEWGWLADVLGVAKVGPVISFFPILLMAVLFGLAMDYQVFLVSRMREEFVKTGDPHTAVRHGFIGAARVVTAAALIMFAVFASFVPGGGAVLQPIALGLAAGVFIDAFLVRMTFIPAVMILLGRWGWALPSGLGRLLPNVDLEGEGVRELLAATEWRHLDDAGRPYAVAASGAVVSGANAAPFELVAEAGELVVVSGDPDTHPDAVIAAFAGRQELRGGHLRVLDQPLPFHAASVRRESVLVQRPQLAAIEPAGSLGRASGRATASPLRSRLEFEVGAELDELWGSAAATEWLSRLVVAAAARPRLMALDATGIPTALLQRALVVLHDTVPLATTIVVAHHGTRIELDGRTVRVLSLAPAPPGSDTAAHLPSKDLSGPSPAAPAAPEPEAPEALPADDLAPREDVTT